MADVHDSIEAGTRTGQYPQVKVPYVHCQGHDAHSQYDEANYEFENTEGDKPLFQTRTSSQRPNPPNAEPATPQSDFLFLSACACWFCWPIGLCAICSSRKAINANYRGDIRSAKISGSRAKWISILAIVVGIIFLVLYILYTMRILKWSES